MNAVLLLEHYARIADAPDAIARLRRLVLDLAVRGKLVEQDAADEPAAELLKRIAAEKIRLLRQKAIKKSEVPDIAPDEIPYLVPSNWQWGRLGHIGDWGAGSTPSRCNSDLYGGGITWLKSGELNDNRALAGSEETVTDAAVQSGSFRLNQPGDVLIAMYGATIGKVAILAEAAVTNQAVCGCTPFTGISNQYLFLFLLSQREQFHGASEGGAQPNISKVKIINTPVPVPPLAEQHRIVAKVDELMALCDQLEAARAERETARDTFTLSTLAKLNTPDPESFGQDAHFALANLPPLTTRPDQIKQLRQTIINLAVRGKLVEQDAADEPASELFQQVLRGRRDYAAERKIRGDKIPSSPDADFALPKSWVLAALGQIAVVTDPNPSHRYPSYDNGTVPLLSTREFRGDHGWSPETAQLTTEDFWLFQQEFCDFAPGDIIFARKGRLGLPRYLPNLAKFTFSHTLFLVKPMQGVRPDYVLLQLRRDETVQWLVQEMNQNTGVPTLGKAKMENLPIALPPLAEQHRIVDKVDELMALCDQLDASITTGEQTRSRLLEAVLHSALEPA